MTSTKWFAAIAVASLASVVAALVSQHVYGMEPCPWCVLQRLIFVVIAIVAAVGIYWRSNAGRWTIGVGTMALADAGIAAALWQHFVAAKSDSCNLTLADRIVGGLKLDSLLPDVFSPRANCADAAVNLLGVPYEFWSLALYLLISLAAIMVPLRSRA
jgi:disulfide bond formation protein DsbB